MGADTVILARGLVKRFGATIALAGPDLAVGAGGAAAARDDAAPGRPGHRALDRPRRHPVDGSTAWRSGTLGSLLSGLMAVLLVARDTREDERG